MTGAPARHVSRPVPRNRSISHGGQVRPSCVTPCPLRVTGPRVSVRGARVTRDGCGCHREQMRLLRVTPAIVLVDRCSCYGCRWGCPREQMRLLRVTLAIVLVDRCSCPRGRYDCRHGRIRSPMMRARSRSSTVHTSSVTPAGVDRTAARVRSTVPFGYATHGPDSESAPLPQRWPDERQRGAPGQRKRTLRSVRVAASRPSIESSFRGPSRAAHSRPQAPRSSSFAYEVAPRFRVEIEA
jgi:hypothetical protein